MTDTGYNLSGNSNYLFDVGADFKCIVFVWFFYSFSKYST